MIPGSENDDWLRPRRDAANSAHSVTPLHLPLKPLWMVNEYVTDVRIWHDFVLALTPSKLLACDLKTGNERWNDPNVEVLGDVTESGQVAVQFRRKIRFDEHPSEDEYRRSDIGTLDITTHQEQWRREFAGIQSSLAIHDGILYFKDRVQGLVRINLSDASVMPTSTPPLGGTVYNWASLAFTDSQILFEDYPWLYALSLDDPQRGTKFYGGGGNPLVAGEYVVATRDTYTEGGAYHRDGKWLRQLWQPARTIGGAFAQSWVPVGENGAVIEPMAPSPFSPDALSLVDIATGQPIWQFTNYTLFSSLSAGDQIILQEWKATDPGQEDNRPYPPQPGIDVRDAQTGRLLLQSEEWNRKPLAAARGYLLVAGDGRFFCLH